MPTGVNFWLPKTVYGVVLFAMKFNDELDDPTGIHDGVAVSYDPAGSIAAFVCCREPHG